MSHGTAPHRSIYQSSTWRRLSNRVVREEPTCWLRLPGCTIRSTTADHIIPVSTRPELALVRTNCRGACRSCNSLRRDLPTTQLAELRARPMTRAQALEALRSKRFRQRPPALRLFDSAANTTDVYPRGV
jgi:5-methylcytosine-specific restriction endonuclease McrA